MASLGMTRVTSASTRNVTVSDQSVTFTVMMRPGAGIAPTSILVKGHGPAMQETRAFSNCCPTPASMVMPPCDAFHLPSGEQGGFAIARNIAVLVTVKVLAVLPTLTMLEVFSAYRTRTSLIPISCRLDWRDGLARTLGVNRTTYSSRSIFCLASGSTSIGRYPGCWNARVTGCSRQPPLVSLSLKRPDGIGFSRRRYARHRWPSIFTFGIGTCFLRIRILPEYHPGERYSWQVAA